MDAENAAPKTFTRAQMVTFVDVYIVGLLRRSGLKISVAKTSYGRKIKVTLPGGNAH